MKKALLVLVFLLGGLCGHFIFLKTNPTQLQKCEDLNLHNPNAPGFSDDPEIKELAKQQGFDSVKDLVDNRCKVWIRNGQEF